jgi:L-malate glycosyltransferase
MNNLKLKTVILTSSYPSKISPVSGSFVQDQAVALSKVFDVAVLACLIPWWRELIAGRNLIGLQREEAPDFKVVFKRMILPPKMPFILKKYLYLFLARRGFEELIETWGKPDIIHAHVVFPSGWVALMLGKARGIPVVLTEHTGPFTAHLTSSERCRIVKDTLGQVDRVVAVSPALAEQIHAFDPSVQIDIVGNVVRTDLFKLDTAGSEGPMRSRIKFLAVALLNKEKGIDYLIGAAHELISRGIDSFDLAIGGDGPARQHLERMVKRLGLSDRCRFLGMLSRHEVREQIQRCDALILPSLGETFGVVLLEAMACGKPVIATRCGGPEFIVTPETGFLVKVADSSAIAEAMESLVSHRVQFDSRVIRGKVTERFGEEAFLLNISKIYDHVLAYPH